MSEEELKNPGDGEVEATKKLNVDEIEEYLSKNSRRKNEKDELKDSDTDDGEDFDSDDDDDDKDVEDDETDDEKDTDREGEDKEEEEPEKPFWKEVLEFVIYGVIVLAVSLFIVTFIGQRTQVIGDSMNPTLTNGDNLIVDKISYRFKDPRRFDVIVFPYQHAKRTYYIKRIIGLPGEEVFIDDNGTIFINGRVLEEDYGKEVILDAGRASMPIVLGSDEYFVMGDNRNNSQDSRSTMVGNIKKRDIIGRAFVRIYPFNEIKLIEHAKEDGEE